jgi:hypothetical protein
LNKLKIETMKKPFKLTPEVDPRCIEYYQKAFPNLSFNEQEKLRVNWISKIRK